MSQTQTQTQIHTILICKSQFERELLYTFRNDQKWMQSKESVCMCARVESGKKRQATHRNMNTQRRKTKKRPNDECFIWWIMYLSQFVSWFDRTHHSNYIRRECWRDKITASTCCCCCCFLFVAHTRKNKSSDACKHIWTVAALSRFELNWMKNDLMPMDKTVLCNDDDDDYNAKRSDKHAWLMRWIFFALVSLHWTAQPKLRLNLGHKN